MRVSETQPCGTPPSSDPDKTGQLTYPIVLDGHPTTALLDHGASTCFLSSIWARQHQLPITALSRPLRLVEFSGTSGTLSEEAKIKQVEFAGTTRSWSFMLSPAYSVYGCDWT